MMVDREGPNSPPCLFKEKALHAAISTRGILDLGHSLPTRLRLAARPQ